MKKSDIKALKAMLESFNPYVSGIEAAIAVIEPLHESEEEQYDANSDRWQQGDKGQAASQRIEHLNNTRMELETARDALDNAINALGELTAAS